MRDLEAAGYAPNTICQRIATLSSFYRWAVTEGDHEQPRRGCSRQKLARDAGVMDEGRDGFGRFTLAHNVRTKPEVDAIVDTAQHAGATVTRAPADTFYGGYAGCFADPDGHVWEIAYNPGFPIADDGTISIPDFSSV